MRLTATNQNIFIHDCQPDILRKIDNATSYLVQGYYFTPQYRSGSWDGRVHLLKFNNRAGYFLPSGLFTVLQDILTNLGCQSEITDKRELPSCDLGIEWRGPKLRPYQIAAVSEVLLSDRGVQTGKVMLKMPVRSGKTMVAAKIIQGLGAKAMFLVNQEVLFKQTINLFQNVLGNVNVGYIGDGEFHVGDVTVAMLQTLMKSKSRDVFKDVGLVFIDEVHHLKTADSWRDVVMSIPSFYKIGLSATIDINPKREATKGAIWLRATTGPIVFEVNTVDLIDKGYLVKPTIYMIAFNDTTITGSWRQAGVYRNGVVENRKRNEIICHLAKTCANKGLKVLVQTSEIKHMRLIAQSLDCEMIYGAIKSQERQDTLMRFRKGKNMILVGTVFGEAVDIPECEVVINAEGGCDDIATLQRLRNLTPAPGKRTAIVFDFADMHNQYLAKHSTARLNAYKREGAFNIRVLHDWSTYDPTDDIGGRP